MRLLQVRDGYENFPVILNAKFVQSCTEIYCLETGLKQAAFGKTDCGSDLYGYNHIIL
jgi:hypothetical protein